MITISFDEYVPPNIDANNFCSQGAFCNSQMTSLSISVYRFQEALHYSKFWDIDRLEFCL